jgi:hypothetical protein
VPAKHHSRATKLAATFLAKLASPDVAAATFRVDVRTVRGWRDGIELPADEWTAIRDVLRARGAEMAARGDTRGLVATLTAAGISDRNVRYSTLISRREARREAEQEPEAAPNLLHEAIEALSDTRTRLMRDAIDLEMQTRFTAGEDVADVAAESDPAPRSDEESQATMLAFVAELAARSDEDVAAESERIRAKLREIQDERMAEIARESLAPPSPVPIAPVTPPEPPRAPLRVLDESDPAHWHPLGRWDP